MHITCALRLSHGRGDLKGWNPQFVTMPPISPNYFGPFSYYYLRRRLASECIASLGVTQSRCLCARRAAYITYRLHAALVSAAKVMRCIQCSRGIITPPPVGGRGIVFGRFLSFFLSFFICFFVSNITRKRLDRFA